MEGIQFRLVNLKESFRLKQEIKLFIWGNDNEAFEHEDDYVGHA